MATPAAPVADLAALNAAAREGFASDVKASIDAPDAPAPSAPAPEPAPAAPAPPVAAPAAPAPPAPPTPAAPAPITIDPATLSPEAAKFLSMFNGDPNAALAKALADTNRLAELHRSGVNVHPGQPDPAATDPNATPATQPEDPAAPPLGPIQVTEQQITQAISNFTATDERILRLEKLYEPIALELEGTPGDPTRGIAAVPGLNALVRPDGQGILQKKLENAEFYAKHPDVVADDFRREAAEAEVLRLQNELTRAEARQYLLQAKEQDLVGKWRARRDAFSQHIYNKIDERQRAYEAEQAAVQEKTAATTALRDGWEPALKAVMAQVDEAGRPRLDPQLYGAFNSYCQTAGIARLQNGMLLDDVAAFAGEMLTEFLKTVDAYHRLQSATYGQNAQHRTEQITGSGGPSAAPTTTTPPAGRTLDEILESTRKSFRSDVEGAGLFR